MRGAKWETFVLLSLHIVLTSFGSSNCDLWRHFSFFLGPPNSRYMTIIFPNAPKSTITHKIQSKSNLCYKIMCQNINIDFHKHIFHPLQIFKIIFAVQKTDIEKFVSSSNTIGKFFCQYFILLKRKIFLYFFGRKMKWNKISLSCFIYFWIIYGNKMKEEKWMAFFWSIWYYSRFFVNLKGFFFFFPLNLRVFSFHFFLEKDFDLNIIFCSLIFSKAGSLRLWRDHLLLWIPLFNLSWHLELNMIKFFAFFNREISWNFLNFIFESD